MSESITNIYQLKFLECPLPQNFTWHLNHVISQYISGVGYEHRLNYAYANLLIKDYLMYGRSGVLVYTINFHSEFYLNDNLNNSAIWLILRESLKILPNVFWIDTYMRSKMETIKPSQVFRSVFRLAHSKICFMLDFSICWSFWLNLLFLNWL